MKRAAALLCAVLALPGAQANLEKDYVSLGMSSDLSFAVWMHKNVRPAGDGLRQTWSNWVYTEPIPVPGLPEKRFRAMRLLHLFDCKSGEMAVRQAAYYTNTDWATIVDTLVLTHEQAVALLQSPTPASMGDHLLGKACAAPLRRQ